MYNKSVVNGDINEIDVMFFFFFLKEKLMLC